MKTLASLFTVLILVGCAAINGPANFDQNEYGLINKVYTMAEVYKLGCSDPEQTKINFSKLSEVSLELVNYSTDIPYNNDTVKLVIPLHKMVSDANVKFATELHTVSYCQLKLDNINLSAGIIKFAVAKRRNP